MIRILALDVGDRRIGIAVSDALGWTAQGVETYTRKSDDLDADVQHILDVASRYQPVRLLFGMPRNMDGSEGTRAALCRSFAQALEEACGLPVKLWDERRTTVEAHNILSQHNYHGKKRKDTVDAVAASLILEGYLAFRRR